MSRSQMFCTASRFVIAVLLLLLSIAGCRDSTNSSGEPLAKIAVGADGGVTIDGERMDLSTARQRLSDIAEKPGAIWFYRDPGMAMPHPTTLALTDILLEANLAVVVSSEPDFADVRVRNADVGGSDP